MQNGVWGIVAKYEWVGIMGLFLMILTIMMLFIALGFSLMGLLDKAGEQIVTYAAVVMMSGSLAMGIINYVLERREKNKVAEV